MADFDSETNFSVSVVIPVYRTDPKLFKDCLGSLAKQQVDYGSIEAVVVFDGEPSEELASIVNDLKKKMPCEIEITENNGVSTARNTGIDLAKGNWIYFLDSDDELIDGALNDLVRFGEDELCDVVIGDHAALLSDGVIERHEYSESSIKPSLEFAERIRHDILIPRKAVGFIHGKLFRASFVSAVNLRFNASLPVGEDTVFVFRAVQSTDRVGYIRKTVLCYHRNSASAVRAFRSDYPDRIIRSMEEMRAQIDQLSNSEDYSRDYSNYVLFHLMLIMVHYLFNEKASWGSSERRKEYRRVTRIPMFREAFENYDPTAFSATRKISLYSLRHRLYFMSKAIARVRHRQMGD